jgi:hypothetical protein
MSETDPRTTPMDSRCNHSQCDSTSSHYFRIERETLADQIEGLSPVGYAERCPTHAEGAGEEVSADWVRID